MRWQWLPLPSPDAVCIDGSRSGISYRSAAGGTNAGTKLANKKRWVLYFQGGGWCHSTADCALRGLSAMGSNSTALGSPHTVPQGHGIIDPCCTVSVDFCDYNKVFFHYCDGASFFGARQSSLRLEASPVRLSRLPPSQVYSAGRAIVASAIQLLVDSFGLGEATDVMVAGFSAGGLAALLNAEAIRTALRAAGAPLRRFKVASFAGVFLPSAAPSSPLEGQLQATFEGARASDSCASWLRRRGLSVGRDAWRCAVDAAPLEVLPRSLPVFVAQSTVDWVRPLRVEPKPVARTPWADAPAFWPVPVTHSSRWVATSVQASRPTSEPTAALELGTVARRATSWYPCLQRARHRSCARCTASLRALPPRF